jgi:hypothetical protein
MPAWAEKQFLLLQVEYVLVYIGLVWHAGVIAGPGYIGRGISTDDLVHELAPFFIDSYQCLIAWVHYNEITHELSSVFIV